MSRDVHESPVQRVALATLLKNEAAETEAMNAARVEAENWMTYVNGTELDVHTAALARKLDAWSDATVARQAALRAYKSAMGR